MSANPLIIFVFTFYSFFANALFAVASQVQNHIHQDNN